MIITSLTWVEPVTSIKNYTVTIEPTKRERYIILASPEYIQEWTGQRWITEYVHDNTVVIVEESGQMYIYAKGTWNLYLNEPPQIKETKITQEDLENVLGRKIVRFDFINILSEEDFNKLDKYLVSRGIEVDYRKAIYFNDILKEV